MIFDLLSDFSEALAAIPRMHPRRHILKLVYEALRRDLHFIDRHREDYPQALFQCMWNSGWWYDCPTITKYYSTTKGHWNHDGDRLYELLQSWRQIKNTLVPGTLWMRSLRPPFAPLDQRLRFVIPARDPTFLCFAPSGSVLAVGDREGRVSLWDMSTGSAITTINGLGAHVRDIKFSSNEHWLAISSGDSVRLCFTRTGHTQETLSIHGGNIRHLGAFPDGQPIELEGNSYSFRVGRTHSDELLGEMPLDYSLFLFRHGTDSPIATLSGASSLLHFPCISNNGQYVAAVCSHPKSNDIMVWEIGVDATEEPSDLVGEHSILGSLECSPDGSRLLTSSMDGSVCVWNAVDGVLIANIGETVHTDRVLANYSTDGTLICSSSRDGSKCGWDANSLRPSSYPDVGNAFPFRHQLIGPPRLKAITTLSDTAIYDTVSNVSVVWSSSSLWLVPIPPKHVSRVWAANDGSHLRLFVIEGDLASLGETEDERPT